LIVSNTSSETSDQDVSGVKPLDIDVDDQIKGIDKETLKCDEDLLKGLCKKVDKVKPNGRVPNDGTTHRSTRPKNLKSAKRAGRKRNVMVCNLLYWIIWNLK
jgi:hypothetical protein